MSDGLWLWPKPLVLASGSATRRQLLESAGIPIEARPATIDERAVEQPLIAAGLPASAIASALARAKALEVSTADPDALVLGGDQTLGLDNKQLHKPASIDAARRQIEALAGRRHVLHSAVAVARGGSLLFETLASATLTMRPLSEGFILNYVAAMGPGIRDSVGAYKLEGLGIHLFESIEGDQSTILGLPLLPVLAGLRRIGALAG